MIHDVPGGAAIDVRVIPRAGTSACAGVRDGRLLVRLAAPPVDGAANDALILFFSTSFHCPKRSVRIVSGEKSRSKRVVLMGVTADAARRTLGQA